MEKITFNREFDKQYYYQGELGALYNKDKTIFRVWSPLAKKVEVKLYDKGNEGNELEILAMTKNQQGVWEVKKSGDMHGIYYNYLVYIGDEINEAVDPYGKAVGVNGNRTMVVDLERTNPENWNNDIKPELKSITDAIIYEAHVRDVTINENSGVADELRGKFAGLVQEGTTIPEKEIKTGLDHIKELGVTHVHLLPVFDYASIDESKLEVPQFNWGYEPKNFNTPEGSYSVDPFNGEVRIKEFKEMVQGLHKAGIRVIMDVVYNHTFEAGHTNFTKIMPGYYYRLNKNGTYSNGSGCGNETASERAMMRKFMVDSLVYWAKEYHIDGFRFDLMAIHDIETMKEIRKELDKVDNSIIVYGEGWTCSSILIPDEEASFKKHTLKYGNAQIAAFSDDCRDAIKGRCHEAEGKGFVNGGEDLEDEVKFAVVASTYHPQIKCDNLTSSEFSWANEPYQTVSYESAHDDNTLWDKLQIVSQGASEEELIKQNKLAAAMLLTSQGIAFLHAGEEILRTKVDVEGNIIKNSYNSPDSVNMIDWNRKEKYHAVFKYYQGLISLRKSNEAFRLKSNREIQQYITFFNKGEEFKDDNVVAFNINGQGKLDGENNITVIYNGNNSSVTVNLIADNWDLVVDGNNAGTTPIKNIKGSYVEVDGKSCVVLLKK